MEIRDASETDAPGILRIYNDAVLNTTAIWNDQLSSLEGRVAWLKERQQSGYPVLVAADGANIFGYASFGPFRPWDGYRHTVEHSVYVDGASRRSGVGHALMDRLILRAQSMNKQAWSPASRPPTSRPCDCMHGSVSPKSATSVPSAANSIAGSILSSCN